MSVASSQEGQLVSSPPQQYSSVTSSPRHGDHDWSSLPLDTLARILKLATEDVNPWEGQKIKMCFRRACKSWRAADKTGTELVVKGSKVGKALSTALATRPRAQRDQVRGLVMLLEAKAIPDGRGRTAAGLVISCPKIERLYLALVDSLVKEQSKEAPFGKALLEAMSARLTLQRLELHGKMDVKAAVFASLLSGLFNLKTLIAPTLVLTHPAKVTFNETPRGIKSVEFNNLHQPFLASLFTSSARNLTHLRLGRITSGFKKLVDLLTPLAPRLVVLEAISTSYDSTSPFMPSFIAKLKLIRTLVIGLEGFDCSQIFSQLALLNETVREVAIVVDPSFSYLQVPASPSPSSVREVLGDSVWLSSLSMPAALVSEWTADELAAVEEDAEDYGVALTLT